MVHSPEKTRKPPSMMERFKKSGIPSLEMAKPRSASNRPSFIRGGDPRTDRRSLRDYRAQNTELPADNVANSNMAVNHAAEDRAATVIVVSEGPQKEKPKWAIPRLSPRINLGRRRSPGTEDAGRLQTPYQASSSSPKASIWSPRSHSPSTTVTSLEPSPEPERPPKVRWSPPFPSRQRLSEHPDSYVSHVKALRDPRFAEEVRKHEEETKRWRTWHAFTESADRKLERRKPREENEEKRKEEIEKRMRKKKERLNMEQKRIATIPELHRGQRLWF